MIAEKKITGQIIGYDPGGNKNHGVAVLDLVDGKLVGVEFGCYSRVESVLETILSQQNPLALGVDTFTCWSSDYSGWRPADLWLKKHYHRVTSSIASPNSLYGSMSVSGMAVIIEVTKQYKNIMVSETHPKVIYYAGTGQKHDYENQAAGMDLWMGRLLGETITTSNDHEWDALAAAYSILQGVTGRWSLDLHQLAIDNDARLIFPAGENHFFWPDKNEWASLGNKRE